MATVILNGNTYTDDSNPSTGMGNGGHRTRFIPCLSDMLAEADIKIGLAEDQVTLAAAQVALAEDQVVLAQDKVNQAAYQVTLATNQVTLAAAQVALAEDQVALAEGQVALAAGYAVASNSAANSAGFKGEWSSLTGSLSLPASVAHNGKFWALTTNLSDVTLAEPGFDSRWYLVGGISADDTLFVNFFLS